MTYASLADIRRYAKGLRSAEDVRILGELDAASGLMTGALAGRFTAPLLVSSTGSLVFDGAPADGDTVTIGGRVYRFVTALEASGDVLLAPGDASDCVAALVAAVNAVPLYAGVLYHADTEINGYARAEVLVDRIQLTVRAGGVDGNATALATTSAAITVVPFAGGRGGPFAALRMICCDLVSAICIRGQATVAVETGTQRDAEALWRAAWARLQTIIDSGVLYADDGSLVAVNTESLPDSSTRGIVPEVGTADPAYWGWDPRRAEVERGGR